MIDRTTPVGRYLQTEGRSSRLSECPVCSEHSCCVRCAHTEDGWLSMDRYPWNIYALYIYDAVGKCIRFEEYGDEAAAHEAFAQAEQALLAGETE